LRKRDGYSRSTFFNEQLDDQDTYALRGSLAFEPSDALGIHVTADFSHNESNGQSRRAVDDLSVPGLGAVVGSGLLSSNVRESDAPWDQWEDQDTAGLTARIDYSFASGSTLTYLSAVRHTAFSSARRSSVRPSSNETLQADYVIAGAGSAGCVLARRLIDAGHTVILLEAGGDDRSAAVYVPLRLGGNAKYDWRAAGRARLELR
jgi:hypothetical protein